MTRMVNWLYDLGLALTLLALLTSLHIASNCRIWRKSVLYFLQLFRFFQPFEDLLIHADKTERPD